MNTKISSIFEPSRANEWWEFKIASILGTSYATAIILNVSFDLLLSFLLFLLASLIPGAIFVSLINDFTDLEDDKLAGKKNRLAGKSKTISLIAIFTCLIPGIVICFFLQKFSLILYLCAWISYTLYSLPPIRLKKRGFWGVLADALGANVFPQLFAISALTDWFDKELDFIWFGAVGVWSLFWGFRGILYHQLKDEVSDKKSQTKTFVQRHKISSIRKLGVCIFFPTEIISFGVMLIYLNSYPIFIFLGLYFFIEWLRPVFWQTDIILLTPTKQYRIFMLDFYCIFYPLGALVSGINFSTFSSIVFIFHIIIFFQSLKNIIIASAALAKKSIFAGIIFCYKHISKK